MPSVQYFAIWLSKKEVWIEAHEHYQNGPGGIVRASFHSAAPLTLNVPLRKGKHQQMAITEVMIAYEEPWPGKHIQSLQTAYGKTAFGEEVLEGVVEILQKQPVRLWI
jgi:hypothetical protein